MIQRKKFRVGVSQARLLRSSKGRLLLPHGCAGLELKDGTGCILTGSVHLGVPGMQVIRTKGSYGVVWAEEGTRDT